MRRIPKPELYAAMMSLVLGVGLLALKFGAYYITRSAVVFSDAMESIANVSAAALALYCLRVAHAPADEDHPYGHGKVEFISAGIEGTMIAVAAILGSVKAASDLIAGNVSQATTLAIGLMVLAMLINGGAGVWLWRMGSRRHSVLLEADGRHLMSDALTSLFAVLGLIASWTTGWATLDPLLALALSGYLALMGLGLVKRSIDGLMDRQDASDSRMFAALLDAHTQGKAPAICSYHKLRHRHSGRYHWVDFHAMVRPEMTVREGHDIASSLEWEIEQSLGSEGKATAHIEPCPGCERCQSSPPSSQQA